MTRRLAALVAAAGWLLVTGIAPASAAAGEQITSYDVVLTIHGDGTLGVRETIDYDFADVAGKHGIFRTIPVRVPYDDGNDRVYELTDVGVSSPTGAPSSVDRSESGGQVTLRIGDPDRTVSGRQEYVVTYTVDGALNAFDDHDELYWNAIGAEWQAPILAATARVELPGTSTQQACFAGPVGSNLPCGEVLPSDGTVAFAQPAGLAPFSALTVVVGLPKGAVAATGPHLEERWSLRGSLTPTPSPAPWPACCWCPGWPGWPGWWPARAGTGGTPARRRGSRRRPAPSRSGCR